MCKQKIQEIPLPEKMTKIFDVLNSMNERDRNATLNSICMAYGCYKRPFDAEPIRIIPISTLLEMKGNDE